MKILHDSVRPELQRIDRELKALKHLRVHVGINGKDDSTVLKYAAIHEYGGTIKPGEGKKNLAIPIHEDAKGKSPRNFEGIKFYKNPNSGYVFAYLPPKSKRGKMKHMFLLLPSVIIPERSYIRASFDTGLNIIEAAIEKGMDNIVRNGWTAIQCADYVGTAALTMTKQYFENSVGPPKGKIARSTSSMHQPLHDTGILAGSITYWIEEV